MLAWYNEEQHWWKYTDNVNNSFAKITVIIQSLIFCDGAPFANRSE